MTTFARVKDIFNTRMAAWRAAPGNDSTVVLRVRHQEASFPDLDANFTADQLKNGKAKTKQLIQPGVPGKDTNLVLALRGQLAPYRQMPGGGPYFDPTEIDEIIDWIDAGCPPV